MHIVTAQEMYEIDRYAMEEIGIDGRILMENAGRAITAKIARVVDRQYRVLVLVGAGNNGGDGFVIARTLLNDCYPVEVLQLVPDEKVTGDAAYHKELFTRFGGSVKQFQNISQLTTKLHENDVIVDAMLGIGISGPLRSPFDEVVEVVNHSHLLKFAVDIPSGAPADEESAEFNAIQADYTLVIEAPKLSAFLQHSAPYYGDWEVVNIGIPAEAFDHYPDRRYWGESETRSTLPERQPFSHKGRHGKGFVIGGSSDMPGSVSMTTEAALRSGAGLVTTGTVPEVIPAVVSRCPEATYVSLAGENGKITDSHSVDMSSFDAIAIGMGMGRELKTSHFTQNVVAQARVPTVIDADGLHHVKEDLSVLDNKETPVILTPHPGEMAMLVDKSVAEVLQQPFAVSKQFSTKYNVYVVLKGTFTIISDPCGKQWVSTSGNAGLAKGGSGDVLSGILLAMIMQEHNMTEALCNGCFIHGKSAEYLVEEEHSRQDLLATDVIKGLRSVFRTFSN